MPAPISRLRRAATGVAALVVLSAAPPAEANGDAAATLGSQPVAVGSVDVVAPDAAATEFGAAIDFDGQRLIATAQLEGTPVVYVFERTGESWDHAATITPPQEATTLWASSVAVHGELIAIADPGQLAATPTESYGAVYVMEASGTVWEPLQEIRPGTTFTYFARHVWLNADGLVVSQDPYCDGSCFIPKWHLYERNGAPQFGLTYTTPLNLATRRRAVDMSVGSDGYSFVMGNPSWERPEDPSDPIHNALMSWDTSSGPANLLLEEVTPRLNEDFEPVAVGWYRKVDVSGDVIAYENCCETHQELHVLRQSGASYVEEANLPIQGPSNGVSVLPGDIVFRADPAVGAWRSYVNDGGTWQPSVDIAAPDSVAAQFEVDPVAAGNEVAVTGDERVWIVTIGNVQPPPSCLGHPATVDLGAGQQPTAADDVIVGTAGADVIEAAGGNDLVCPLGGDDIVTGGAGGDLLYDPAGANQLRGGGGNDIIAAGSDGDLALGGAGNDIIVGGDSADLLLGGKGNDLLQGGPGADALLGGADQDQLFGQAGTDSLVGGPGTDHCDTGNDGDPPTASCETTSAAP